MRASVAVLLLLLLLLLVEAVDVDARSFQRLRAFRGHGHQLQAGDASAGDAELANVSEAFFDGAILDHFAPVAERAHWKQRYYVNEEFWGGRGYPVFLYIGGEGPLGARAITNHSYIHFAAEQHRALLVALEHRFYGKSYPTVDMSLPHLRYLSSEQALADIAHFHSFLSDRFDLDRETKWVGFGGSYPGNLAAWLKLKYPALFVGTIASSAPVHAKVDFSEYMEVVGDGLRYFGGGECYRQVEKSILELRVLMDDKGQKAQDKLAKMFSPCYPMTNEFDDSVFESSVMGAFQDIAQYNQLHDGLMTLSDVCDHFTKADANASPLETLASFLVKARDGPCLDSKFEGAPNATVETLSEDKFDGQSSARQWIYQTCNEFGYFQTTASVHSPFHALSAVTEQNVGSEICKRVYGIDVSPDVGSTNIDYGSLGITVENVTFPSGTIDPWHALAVQNSTTLHSSTAAAVFIEGTAHCADMYYPKANDIAQMQWAHEKIAEAITRYLGIEKVDAPEAVE
jgi:serine protease 16